MLINRPIPFPVEAEVTENLLTHRFDSYSGRCFECDCRISHTAATWPCGADVPRETVSD